MAERSTIRRVAAWVTHQACRAWRCLAAGGWGLALCRVVCERRGGGVHVARSADRRTVFTADVPIAGEVRP